MRILLVEDHPTHLKLAHAVLTGEGHSVTTVSAAEEALVCMAFELPEVILLDMSLPGGMDGVGLVRHLKADARTRHIPVVAVTSYTDLYGEAEARAIGCSTYLTKPIGTRDLNRHLADAVRRQGRWAPAERAP